MPWKKRGEKDANINKTKKFEKKLKFHFQINTRIYYLLNRKKDLFFKKTAYSKNKMLVFFSTAQF